MDVDDVTRRIIGSAIEVHKGLGPGLLESVYETCLCHELDAKGIAYIRQSKVPITYKGINLECGYRLDLLVENKVIVELKSVDKLTSLHDAQLISYLRLTSVSVGLLINFNVPTLMNGIKRKVLNYYET